MEDFPVDVEMANLPPIPERWPPCEHRVRVSEKSKHPVCRVLSLLNGHTVGVQTYTCAKCRPTGEGIDESYMNKLKSKIAFASVNRVVMGVYAEEDAEIVFRRSYEALKNSQEGRIRMGRAIEQAVSNKRISHQRAEKLIQDHMPEMLSDEYPGAAEAAEGAEPLSTAS